MYVGKSLHNRRNNWENKIKCLKKENLLITILIFNSILLNGLWKIVFPTSGILELSTTKSNATPFTTWNRKMYNTPNVNANSITIPAINKPKILGVTVNNLLTFASHARNASTKSE